MKRIPLSKLAWVAAAAILLPAITFAAPATTTQPAVAQKAHATKAVSASHWGKSAMHRVDVNSATREELMAVQGIDGAAADKIIEGRPWKSPQALVEKNVLTKNDFAKVKSRIMTKRPAAPAKTQ
jgi:DNA uptake protein ComE-like DNA-binding protein